MYDVIPCVSPFYKKFKNSCKNLLNICTIMAIKLELVSFVLISMYPWGWHFKCRNILCVHYGDPSLLCRLRFPVQWGRLLLFLTCLHLLAGHLLYVLLGSISATISSWLASVLSRVAAISSRHAFQLACLLDYNLASNSLWPAFIRTKLY
jgi:hypothetical protein